MCKQLQAPCIVIPVGTFNGRNWFSGVIKEAPRTAPLRPRRARHTAVYDVLLFVGGSGSSRFIYLSSSPHIFNVALPRTLPWSSSGRKLSPDRIRLPSLRTWNLSIQKTN